MSAEFKDPSQHRDVNASADESVPRLFELARQALEQKRRQDCLDITKAILLIDPHHKAALSLRTLVQSEIQQDLVANARAFLHKPASNDATEESTDAGSNFVRHQLARVREDLKAKSPEVNEEPRAPKPSQINSTIENTKQVFNAGEKWAKDVGTSWIGSAQARFRPLAKPRWFTYAGVVVILGVAFVAWPRSKGITTSADSVPRVVASTPAINNPATKSAPAPISEPPIPTQDESRTTTIKEPETRAVETPVIATTPAPKAVATPKQRTPVLEQRTPPVAAAARVNKKSTPEPVVVQVPGKLAVSSPTSVDIYRDDVYVGSAPVSIELPPGTHTLEYRHGNLRKKLTHEINSNETTRAMVTFDVTVQINANPWADVYLEGSEKKALGQTPLSGVRVPVGGVLSFENPKFPAKKYRVTGNETGIQIAFP